jgi:hypothetical protein
MFLGASFVLFMASNTTAVAWAKAIAAAAILMASAAIMLYLLGQMIEMCSLLQTEKFLIVSQAHLYSSIAGK